MGHYSEDPAHVQVDVFKPSGKWYMRVQLDMRSHYNDVSIPDALIQMWQEQQRTSPNGWRCQGMWMVCLEPYHKNEHPQMVQIPIS